MAVLLAEVRRRRGWTQARLQHELRQAAARLHLSLPPGDETLRVMISGWERGRHVPREHHQLLLQEVYGVPAEALGFAPEPQDVSPAAAILTPLVRKQAIELTPDLAAYFARQLNDHARVDNLAGPTMVVDTVLSQLARLDALSGPEAERLASHYAEFAGWLLHDSGDAPRALALTDKAVDLAELAGDQQLTAYNLMRKSNVLSSMGEDRRAAAVARRAVVLAREGAPDQLPVCLRQVATCEARLQNEAGARDALEQALVLAEPAMTGDEFSSYCTTSFVEMEAAAVALTLGRPGEAVKACHRALHVWPAELVRDQALCHARLAAAHLDLRQLDEAMEAVRDAIDRVRSAPSGRTLHALQHAATKLEPFRQDREVRDVLREIAQVA